MARSLDPEGVLPKENEFIEVSVRSNYARGLAHGATLQLHVSFALHWFPILYVSVLMFFRLACERPCAQNFINNAFLQVCNEHVPQVPHQHVSTTRSHLGPNRPDPAAQTPVPPTITPPPRTYRPVQDPPAARSPSTTHNTPVARTSNTGTTRRPASMRTTQAPMPPRHHPSTGAANRHPPHAPSAYAYGCHRRPCPVTRADGAA